VASLNERERKRIIEEEKLRSKARNKINLIKIPVFIIAVPLAFWILLPLIDFF
jgi:hypothetical protein